MFTDRLEQFINFKGLSLYAFENSIKASRGSISKALKNRKSIGSNVVENILTEYSDLNANWLFTGEGKMIKSNLDEIDAIDKIKIIKHLKDNLEDYEKIKSFRLLLESIQGDNELSDVKSDILKLQKQVEELLKSKNA